ncbi:hypothetical protein ABZZ36_18245 [Actinacidiphila glaucinigra]|uniref:hypothetical protein n=1 Tax=Actinacidiphila glaucinigra TaxID=235986 RepID=UPI0033B0BCED
MTAEQPRTKCGHWIGDERRHCGAVDGVRRYLNGHRCPLHTPAALMGIPEPQPGPGIPAYRTEATSG